jgi:hypothetical protein
MKLKATACLVIVLAPTGLWAGSLEKAYFAVTESGSWAKHESNWEMPDGTTGTNIYTSIRAADSEGRVRIEMVTETLAGPGAGMTVRQLFIMESSFDLPKDYLNRMMFLEATASQAGDAPPSLMPENVIEIMRGTAGDLTNSVAFEGGAERAGRKCDLYTYSYRTGGPHASLLEGEICLDETTPFGVVYQKGRVLDAEGNVTSSYEEKLVGSGTGASATAALLAMTPEASPKAPTEVAPAALPSVAFLEAYESGKVRLLVEVTEGTGGRRLTIVVLNATDDAFELLVPEGPLSIPADSPLGELKLFFREARRFSLPADGSSPTVEAGQPGDRGATGGTFQLTVYEGQPLSQGSVTVGPLE